MDRIMRGIFAFFVLILGVSFLISFVLGIPQMIWLYFGSYGLILGCCFFPIFLLFLIALFLFMGGSLRDIIWGILGIPGRR